MIVARVYEKVTCAVHMGKHQFDFFSSDIGIKQGYPLSPTLFGLCIDELEETIQCFGSNEGINNPEIAHATILLPMNANNVVLLSRTKADANKLMKVLEDFCNLNVL